MSAELAMQKAIYQRLISSADVTALVPIANIKDRNQQPIIDPSILIGECQSSDQNDSISRSLNHLWFDLHVWKKEPDTVGSKRIAGAIKRAIRLNFQPVDGYHFADCHVSGTRFLRDPDGEHSHAVVTVEAILQEVA